MKVQVEHPSVGYTFMGSLRLSSGLHVIDNIMAKVLH